jgi:hypothetical protein
LFLLHRCTHSTLSASWKRLIVECTDDDANCLFPQALGGRDRHGNSGASPRSQRTESNGAMLGRKAELVHQQLAPIERTETGRERIAEPNIAEGSLSTGSVTETVFENCSAE